ncbi:plastocyanin/azurin family copper-binding protein [Blastococcus litoris]|uniref:plastocyanin/azurin family copper-binding protein n=1 Tax=Blastococcus litoris TaxID=2171622 RepID=UPI001F12F6EB|nr:plastocyanin/azurin family copper-binding protein [Blastococcus litoris]
MTSQRNALGSSPSNLSRRAVLLTGLAGAGALALAACGDDPEQESGDTNDAASAGQVTVAPDGTQEITVLVQDDYDFRPSAFAVTTGRVRLTLTSEAKELTHNIRFTPGRGPAEIEEEIPIVAPGERETVEFAVEQPGDYQYECSFHVALGQIGTMTVTAA